MIQFVPACSVRMGKSQPQQAPLPDLKAENKPVDQLKQEKQDTTFFPPAQASDVESLLQRARQQQGWTATLLRVLGIRKASLPRDVLDLQLYRMIDTLWQDMENGQMRFTSFKGIPTDFGWGPDELEINGKPYTMTKTAKPEYDPMKGRDEVWYVLQSADENIRITFHTFGYSRFVRYENQSEGLHLETENRQLVKLARNFTWAFRRFRETSRKDVEAKAGQELRDRLAHSNKLTV